MRSVTAFAPGRVNLAGEHTDYNLGLALPFAITEGVTVTASALERPWIEALALDLGEEDAFALDEAAPQPGWRAFVRGAVGELQRGGFTVPGARLEISGTVPRGSGLSSSAALSVALVLALLALADHPDGDRIDLAKLCSRIENDWVGARTGLLDQLACLFGQPDHALRIDFRSLQIDPIPLELGDWRLVVLDSGQRRDHATSGYNQRRQECARACQLLGIASLREATADMVASLPSPLDRRVRHVLGSNARVDQAVEALRQRDLEALGALLDASQTSLRELYEVSTPAVEDAVARLKRAGAAGARLMGGGFGGQVMGLMPPDARLPEESFQVSPGPAAHVASASPGAE